MLVSPLTTGIKCRNELYAFFGILLLVHISQIT